MKEVNKKQKFLELRAQGKSFRVIESEIGTNRGTLAKWASECKEELENLQAMELEALREEYRLTVRARVERFGDQLQRVMQELEKRNLATVPTAKLVEIAIKLDSQLQGAAPAPSIPSEEVLASRRTIQQLVDSLAATRRQPQRLGRDQAREGNGKVKGEDLVALQIAILQRYNAGDIDGRSAATEMGMLDSIFKGIDIADLQTRLERIEAVLNNGRERS